MPVWKNKYISLALKVRLYESLAMSTMLYSAELWPLSVTQKKKLEAAHHKFQRWILGISWRDKVRNEEVREKTTLQTICLTIKEGRLRWLGHVLQMDDNRLPEQAIYWEANNRKRRPGRPRQNWLDIIWQDWRKPAFLGRKHKNAPLTEKISIDVWPNVS